MEKNKQAALVSIVVPAYNSASTLRKCLDSVLCQNDRAVEIVVVDDGSTDESAAIAREYAQAHPNIHVLQQQNAGPSVARNVGMDACTGEWIMFLDADDTQAPHTLASLRAAMSDSTEAILFPVQKLLPSGEVVRERGYVAATNAQGMAECILLPEGPYQGYMTNKCVRANIARKAGPLNTELRYCEDEEWWLRAAAAIQRMHGSDTCVCILDDYLYTYNQQTDGLRIGALLNVSASARDVVVDLVEHTWPELAHLARQRHALWQNRVVVGVLRSKDVRSGVVLHEVLHPAYRRDVYRSHELGLGVKAKTCVLGVVGAALAVIARKEECS